VAAFCTTVSYVPQLKKCWETGSAGDLSLKMFLTLAAGVAFWIVYGVLKQDAVDHVGRPLDPEHADSAPASAPSSAPTTKEGA